MQAEHQINAGNTRPVIVADKLVCKEIRELEDEIEAASLHAAHAALEEGLEPLEVFGCSEVARMIVEEDRACFLHELGWFFQSSSYGHLKDPTMLDTVSTLVCLRKSVRCVGAKGRRVSWQSVHCVIGRLPQAGKFLRYLCHAGLY